MNLTSTPNNKINLCYFYFCRQHIIIGTKRTCSPLSPLLPVNPGNPGGPFGPGGPGSPATSSADSLPGGPCRSIKFKYQWIVE